jgi:uncharacterized protein YsxB (DUF464 family)
MIRINVITKNNIIESVTFKGHANYDDYGKDIVCAAVSSTYLCTVNAIFNLNNNAIDITNKEEWLECRGYTLDDALTNLGGQKVFEDENWVYVLANKGKSKIKFKKSSNAWDINMF